MVTKQQKNSFNRRDSIIRLTLLLAIVFLLNVVSHFYYLRFDLTSEKRYSISPPSKKMLKNLNDVVMVKVFLDGKLNAGFSKLRDATENMLKEFRAYGGKSIEYEFFDPMSIQNADEQKKFIEDIMQRGVTATDLTTKSKSDTKRQYIFPSALVNFGGREIAVNLLENQRGLPPDMILAKSEIWLEYKFANAIKKLTEYRSPRIGFLKGNDEIDNEHLADMMQTLQQLQYDVRDFNIDSSAYIPHAFDLMIVAKPQKAFDEKQKYKLDQFIMRGGKMIWLLEGTNAEMDSLRYNQTGQFVQGVDMNLDDMLFKYGARTNTDVVQDINLCNPIPLTVGKMGSAPQLELFPWYYFPLLVSENNHPIVRNLDPVASFFASSIDTIKNPEIRKTILLHTSENSKAQLAPTRVHFGILQGKPNKIYYNQPKLPVAVLLEGEFESVFKNRLAPEFLAASDTIENLKFKEKSAASKMIVIADGDIIRNNVKQDGTGVELGYYDYTGLQYANKDFILNCIEELVDADGIYTTRSKEVKLRMLDSVKTEDEKLKWQLINIALPIFLLILFGAGFNFYRRKKYSE